MTDSDDRAWEAANAAVTRLENAWKQSPCPDLGQFLPPPADPIRERVLVELVKVDLEHRWRTGNPKKVEDFLVEWRELEAKPEIALELLLAECLAEGAPSRLLSQTGAIPTASGPDETRSRNEHILRHPVCGPLLRKVADEQYLLTRDMLADEPAANRVVTLHNATFRQLIEQLPVLPTAGIACRPGCAYCCHLRVEVQPYEALAIAAFLRQHRTPEELAALTEALRQRVRQIRKLTPDEQITAQLKCVFLDEHDNCSIHARRPVHCVGLTSRSADDCKAAFQDGKGRARITVHLPTMACTQGVMSGAALAMRELGLEAGYYELTAAVLTALEAPDAAQRWLCGEAVFSSPPPPAKSPRAAGPHARSPNSASSPSIAGPPSRNSPCPCGSGKKYKQCCLRKGPSR